MNKIKAVARTLCPPLLWNLASRIRYPNKLPQPEWKTVHGVKMHLPASHALPSIVANFPQYDTLLPEFLHFLRDVHQRKLLIVDVGANVGDTAALVAAKVGAENIRLICLEADELYLPFLRTNTNNLDAKIIHAIVGATSQEKNVSVQRNQTAQVLS